MACRFGTLLFDGSTMLPLTPFGKYKFVACCVRHCHLRRSDGAVMGFSSSSHVFLRSSRPSRGLSWCGNCGLRGARSLCGTWHLPLSMYSFDLSRPRVIHDAVLTVKMHFWFLVRGIFQLPHFFSRFCVVFHQVLYYGCSLVSNMVVTALSRSCVRLSVQHQLRTATSAEDEVSLLVSGHMCIMALFLRKFDELFDIADTRGLFYTSSHSPSLHLRR